MRLKATRSSGPIFETSMPDTGGETAMADLGALEQTLATISFALDGTILRANPNFLDLVGYPADEIVGRSLSLVLPEAAAEALKASLGPRDSRALEVRGRRRDGAPLWMRLIAAPVRDAAGQPVRILAHATDITAERLRAADEHGQIAAINLSQAVVHFDLDGIVLDANRIFLETLGYRRDEIVGRHHRMFVEPSEARGAAYAAFWRDLARGRHRAAEFRRLGKDGREVWLRATYNPVFDPDGRPFKVVKYATDVTRERLRQADHQGQIAAIDKAHCVIAFAMDGTILEANENFLAAMGYRRDEVIGRHHRMFVEPDFAGTADYAEFWNTLRSGSFHSAMYKRIGKDGREVWIQASYNPIFDLNGRPYRVVKLATDVTASVALGEALRHAKQQAQRDAATALPNRVRLSSFMTSALAVPEARLAVLYLDLDRFKPVNDTFGHQTGDRVLVEIADRLRRTISDDQLVARVGGDEFVVAAPEISDEEIDALCRRLIETVTAPIARAGGTIAVGLSIGVAVSPTDGATPDDLLGCADVALYRAKAAGRGTYRFFAKAMNARVAARRDLAEDMRRGIENEEFFLDYQPRFRTRGGALQSVEALVRWAHPERGLVPPGDFIPLAEKSGLIVPLGGWVLRTACRAAATWPGIGVSVNVSPIQFRSETLVDTVRRVLAETGLEPRRLELEITEGVLLDDTERAHVALDGLKALGVRLAIDDFGTGYSSLSYLRSFPFDVIKIDRRFIADIEAQGGRQIVQAILGLGKALGLTVTAEGVETAGQLLMLTLDDCAEVQGFLLARPMSEADLLALMADGERRFGTLG